MHRATHTVDRREINQKRGLSSPRLRLTATETVAHCYRSHHNTHLYSFPLDSGRNILFYRFWFLSDYICGFLSLQLTHSNLTKKKLFRWKSVRFNIVYNQCKYFTLFQKKNCYKVWIFAHQICAVFVNVSFFFIRL